MSDEMGDEDRLPVTTKCGFGYMDMCCCICEYQLVAKPRCHHTGGKGKCGDALPKFFGQAKTFFDPESPLTALAKAEYKEQQRDLLQDGDFVCLAFANEGIVQTDWTKHGCCECFELRKNLTSL